MLEGSKLRNHRKKGFNLPKTNYSYAKRQRELAKKQKKEEKRREKARIAEESNADSAIQSPEGKTQISDTQA